MSFIAAPPLTAAGVIISSVTDTAEHVLEEIRASDPGLAMDAEAVLGSLTWGEGIEVITREGVQQFLWYTLPLKFLVDVEDHHRIARAAAVLLQRLGLDRYAEIARSPATHEILDAYTRSDAEGFAAYRRAQEASGIEPPDLDDLSWGSVMGIEEARAMSAVASALELAIYRGELHPGSRGWRSIQRRIAASALDADHPVIPGQSWRTVVLTERLEQWTSTRVDGLARLRKSVANGLLHPVEPDVAAIAAAVEPFTWLLAAIGDGVQATQKGNLSREFVRSVALKRGWWDLPGQPNREEEVLPLHLLHALGRTTNALRRRGRRIGLTKTGRAITADPVFAWRSFIMAMTRDDFERQALEIIFLVLLDSDEVLRTDVLHGVAAHLATEMGWRTGASSIDAYKLANGVWLPRRWLLLFGMLLEEGPWDAQTSELTDVGRITALTFLRQVATGPRQRPL